MLPKQVMLFNKQHCDMSTHKNNRMIQFLIKILIVGLEIVIGRAPSILGWAYACCRYATVYKATSLAEVDL